MNEKEKIILYIIKKLTERNTLITRKKIMKLLFLLDFENIIDNKKTIFDDWIIYYFGVFSRDAFNEYLELLDREIIEEKDLTVILKKNIKNIQLNKELKEKLDNIIEKYGSFSGKELEKITLEKINLNINEKERYFNFRIRDLIKNRV